MKKQTLYEDLRRQILTLNLEPGTLLEETSLSERYGLSRTPLREVFRQLAGEGYLELSTNRGAMVSSMNHKTLRNFFLTAPLIYAAVGRLAAENATPAQRLTIVQAQDAFRQAVAEKDAEGMVFWNDAFHRTMGAMADNPYLRPSYERLLIDHTRIGQTFYRPRDPDMNRKLQQALEHHDRMIECLERHDAEALVALIAEHWALSRNHLERYVRPDPLPMEAGLEL